MTYTGFAATADWRARFPGAIAATMTVRDAVNPVTSAALEAEKRVLERALADRWAAGGREALRADPVLAAYDAYYKRFGQNYHVRMQIESIALKGKGIPSRAALVEAMFMAELESGVLAAVHDLDQVRGEVSVIATTGAETYTRYDGVDEACKPGDMAMRDDQGILTSVIQGPTTLARVTSETTAVLFCLYAPSGTGESAVGRCLDDLERYVAQAAPGAIGFERTLVHGARAETHASPRHPSR
jgi:DNA/RNA-binding domain of Phe-tRNA-synthetase-like protein